MQITLKATVNQIDYEHVIDVINEDGQLSKIARGYLDRGIQKVLTDAASTATRGKGDNKRKATEDERAEDVEKRLAKLIDGSYTFGGGGGGLTPHDKAIRQILRDSGYKGWVKLADETVETALVNFTEALAKQQDKEWDESFVEDMRQKIEGVDNFADIVAEHQPKKKVKAAIGVTLAD